jgi:hypothetical protein
MTIVSVPKNVWTTIVTASADTIIENLGHPEVFITTETPALAGFESKKLTITTLVAGDVAKVFSVNKPTDINYFEASGGGAGLSFGDTYETVSNNLDASDATLNYTGDVLTSIDYANGVTKTLNYTGDVLTTVVLSGTTPGGIDLTKTLSYTGDALTGVAYS